GSDTRRSRPPQRAVPPRPVTAPYADPSSAPRPPWPTPSPRRRWPLARRTAAEAAAPAPSPASDPDATSVVPLTPAGRGTSRFRRLARPSARPPRRSVVKAIVGAGVATALTAGVTFAIGRDDHPDSSAAEFPAEAVYTIVVVGDGANPNHQIQTSVARLAVEDMAARSPGLPAIEVLGIDQPSAFRSLDGMIGYDGLLEEHPEVIAVIGDPDALGDLPADTYPVPRLRTCDAVQRPVAENPPFALATTPADQAAGVAAYLNTRHDVRRLLVMGDGPAVHTDALSKALPLEARGATVAVEKARPDRIGRVAVQDALEKHRPDAVYLNVASSDLAASATALDRAGFAKPVVGAPDTERGCARYAGAADEGAVPDGVLRVRSVSRGLVRAECEAPLSPELCKRVAADRPAYDFPDGLGTLEEYQAATAVATALRDLRADTPPENPLPVEIVREELQSRLADVEVPDLTGSLSFDPTRQPSSHPVWIEQRKAGGWRTLGTTAALVGQ
ncbi:hypothetical protein ACFWEG_23025, partial [Streptomyces sp. NPDC060194]